MSLADGTDLLPGLRYVAPDDGNPHDRTVAEVPLPRAAAPGETVHVAIDFRSRLPRVSNRTGYKGDFFFVAQWFPKLGVLEETGWNCHQFDARSEFFADFGNYDVSIDVPEEYRGKVGATGVRAEERNAPGNRVLYRFRQDSVHDFAWTADPDYRVHRDVFREPGFPDVELILLLQPEHARTGRAPLPGRESRPLGLRARAGALSLSDAHARGPRLGRQRGGRHGVPDPDHVREPLERAGVRPEPRERHRP